MKTREKILLIPVILCLVLFIANCIAAPIFWFQSGGEVSFFATPITVILPGLATSCFLFSFKKSYMKHFSLPAGICTLTAIYFALLTLSENETLIKKSDYLDAFDQFNAAIAIWFFFCTYFFIPVLIMYFAWIITKGDFIVGKCILLTAVTFVFMTMFFIFFYHIFPGSFLILDLIPVMIVPSLSFHTLRIKHKLCYCCCVGAGGVCGMIFIRLFAACATMMSNWEVANNIAITIRSFHLDFVHMPYQIAIFLFGVAVCLSFLYLAHIIKEKKRSKEGAIDSPASQEL